MLATFPKIESIEAAWQFYIHKGLPGLSPTSVQYQETKKAFFSGAAGMLAILAMGARTRDPKASERHIIALRDECTTFLARACHKHN